MYTCLWSHTGINVQLKVIYIEKSSMGLKEKPFTAQEHGLFLELKVKLYTSTDCRKSLIPDLQFISYPAPVCYYSPTNVLGLRSALIYIFCTFINCVGSVPRKKKIYTEFHHSVEFFLWTGYNMAQFSHVTSFK